MVNGIGSNINSLQLLRAVNAFKAEKPVRNNIEDTKAAVEIEDRVSLQSVAKDFNSNPVKAESKVPGIGDEKLNEIKNMSNKIGDKTLTNDEINYGFRYGRSVLVDYSA